MFFLLFLHDDRRIRIRIQEAQKHVDPVDPDSDPQHWFYLKLLKLLDDGFETRSFTITPYFNSTL